MIPVSLSHVHRGASRATAGSMDQQSISWMKVNNAPKVGRTWYKDPAGREFLSIEGCHRAV